MIRTNNIKIPITSIWFFMFIIYIVTSYIALEGLLPTYINSIALYAFLAYSVLAIIYTRKIRFTPMLLWESGFLLLAFISMLYSPSFSIFDGTYYSLIVNFIIVLVLTQMPWNKSRFALVLKTFVVSSVGLMIILMVTGLIDLDESSGRFGESLTGNANIFACMLMMGALFSMWLLIYCESVKGKVLYLLSIIILYIGMFMSGGRKYILIPIVFAYVILLYKFDKKGKRHPIKSTIIGLSMALIVYLLIMNVPVLYESIGNRFDSFFALFGDRDNADGSALNREKMIAAAIDEWIKSPVWGYGFDSFKYYNASNVTGRLYYSHNNYCELLYNQGLVGFVAYYSI